MTSKYDHVAATNYLSNLCKDGTPLRGRIALLSFPNEISAKIIDTAIMLVEYSQLMALVLRAASRFYSEQATNSFEIYPLLSVFIKFLIPGNLLPVNKDGLETIKRVLELCISLYVLRISLFFYIIWLAFKRKTNSGFLVRSWRWIFYLQTKVFFNIFTSIYSNIYESASKDLLGLDSSLQYTYMAGCLIMIALEFAFSLVLTTQFTNILPFKRFSASKNNALELNVLMQKFTNNMLRRLFGFSMNASIWIYGSMNIIFSLARIYQFFRKLPVYNYKALKLQMFLLIATFTSCVASFANVALDWRKINMNFVIITWAILTIFCTKLAFAFLEKNFWFLVFEKGINTKRSPEFLLHKIIFIKQILIQNELPLDTSSKSDVHHLLCSALNLNSTNLQCKTTRDKIFIQYLEDLMSKFPKNNFLKLYSAYRYVLKNKLYGLSIKTLAEINSNYPTVVASKSILKHFIQTKTQFDYQHGDYTLNLYDYCQGVAKLSKIKIKMAEQAKIQWNLCNEIISTSPDLAKILRLGNKVQSLKVKIHKNFKTIEEQMPDYFVKPHLLYASYNLFLGYNSEDHTKYKELSSQRSQKYQKLFENDRLLQENLFQEDTSLIAVSCEKETAGIINYISPKLVDILGRNLTGSQASITTPPFLRANTTLMMKTLTGRNAKSVQNTMRSQFFYHLKGYMVPFNYYININPSIYGGLSFIFICRCANQDKESILLNEEGEIESFTKGIGETLGLFSKDGLYLVDTKTPISQICPQLARINQAFNIVASPPPSHEKTKQSHRHSLKIDLAKSYKTMRLEEAKEIHRIYSSEEGKNITFTPILQTHSLTYHCTIKTLMVGTKIGKIVTLEKVHHETIAEENKSPIEADFDNIDFEENANSEWINFDRLKSDQQAIMTTRNDNLSSARQLISSRRPEVTEANEKLILREDTCSDKNMTKVNPQEVKKLPEKYKPHWFLLSNQNKINQHYKQALDKPYSPFFYNIFVTTLYALFLTVFVMYLYMSVNMHQGISDLQTSKQILRLAEARNNYLGILDGTTRLLWTYATQLSDLPDFFQGTFASLRTVLSISQHTVDSLGTVNNNLFALTTSLDENKRENLFKKDIRMLDSSFQVYMNLTSFQATDRMVDASLKSNNLVLTNLQLAVRSLEFVLRNIMNDNLLKNTEISQSFSDSLQDKKDYFANWITVCFSTSLCLLLLIIAGFIFVLYLQAKSESNNLFALTRLKPEPIHNLKQDFIVFHNMIIEDTHQSFPSDEANKKRNSSSKQRQFPIYQKLWPIYYLNFLKMTLLILIPMVLFLTNFILFKEYLNQLSTKASQIYFVDQMTSRFGVISGSFLEVTSENDTTVIYNKQASVSLSQQISQISEMIQGISYILRDSEDNDLIQDILYGDACAYRKDKTSFSLCQSLANYQKKPSLINLLNNIKLTMNLVYSKFVNSNRTLETLLGLQAQVYNELCLKIFLVVQEETKLIAEILSDDFERIASHSQSLNISLNTVILVLIVAESLIIHFLIINRLKQKEKQFKQILGLFPANIVLPNFILKSYIIKNSNQTFHSFHDNI